MTSAFQRLAEALGELDRTLAQDHPDQDHPDQDDLDQDEPGSGEPGSGEPGLGGPGLGGARARGAQDETPGRRPVGALAEELARFLESWQQTARTHTGPDCRACPVCQVVAMLRQTRPEVIDHLVTAAGELATAVRLVVAPPTEPAPPPGHRSSAPVERIDVTD
jgi:hypothetical protein